MSCFVYLVPGFSSTVCLSSFRINKARSVRSLSGVTCADVRDVSLWVLVITDEGWGEGQNFRFKELMGKKPETSCATESTAGAYEISQPGMMRVNKCNDDV